jgi:AAA domain
MPLPKPVEKLLRFFAPSREEPSEPQYHYIQRHTPAVRERSDEGASFPRFQSTAGDHLDPRSIDGLAMVRAKLRNAYNAQPVTDRRMFAGRTRVLTALIGSIEEQRLHTVICGERGIGKSSLLHMLARAAADARYLVVYLACTAGSDFDETFRAIATNIPLAYHHGYGPTSVEGERGDTLVRLLGPEPITVRYAVDLLAKVEGTRVLVILDEFDRAASEDFRRNITELLWSLSDQAVRVHFVIAGVAANAGELVANVTHREVFALQLPRMTAAEIRSLIKNGEAIADLEFDDAAVQAIIARCIGFPYLASLISHRAALVAADQNRLTVSAEDVDVGTHEAVEELRGRISPRSQLQVGDATRMVPLTAVAALAEAALNTSGWFGVDARQGRVAADRLAAQNLLLEVRDDGVDRAYRFADPNVPIYIWLLAVQEASRA